MRGVVTGAKHAMSEDAGVSHSGGASGVPGSPCAMLPNTEYVYEGGRLQCTGAGLCVRGGGVCVRACVCVGGYSVDGGVEGGVVHNTLNGGALQGCASVCVYTRCFWCVHQDTRAFLTKPAGQARKRRLLCGAPPHSLTHTTTHLSARSALSHTRLLLAAKASMMSTTTPIRAQNMSRRFQGLQCVCVCVRERERDCVCDCVCVCA